MHHYTRRASSLGSSECSHPSLGERIRCLMRGRAMGATHARLAQMHGISPTRVAQLLRVGVGECVRCQAPPMEGTLYCEDHRREQTEYQSRRRRRMEG